jgi:hypothetical protein
MRLRPYGRAHMCACIASPGHATDASTRTQVTAGERLTTRHALMAWAGLGGACASVCVCVHVCVFVIVCVRARACLCVHATSNRCHVTGVSS